MGLDLSALVVEVCSILEITALYLNRHREEMMLTLGLAMETIFAMVDLAFSSVISRQT